MTSVGSHNVSRREKEGKDLPGQEAIAVKGFQRVIYLYLRNLNNLGKASIKRNKNMPDVLLFKNLAERNLWKLYRAEFAALSASLPQYHCISSARRSGSVRDAMIHSHLISRMRVHLVRRFMCKNLQSQTSLVSYQ